MRAILGLLMIMLGLAMAVVWMPEHDGERQLSLLTEIATQGLPRHTGAPPAAERQDEARTFSPRTPLMAAGRAPAPTQPAPTDQRNTPTVTIYEQASEAPRTGQSFAATQVASVVTGSMALSTPLTAETSAQSSSVLRPQPVPTMSREDLVRSLQRELRRVGCYWGEIDGSWGAGSKRAIASFMDRVNASLPIEQPDFILLTLLQNHGGSVCGKDCPAGQSLSENGRCLPNAVVAKASRSSERRIVSRETRSVQEQAEAREADRAQAAAAVQPSLSAAAMAPLAAVGAVAAAVAPIPGRMAVGGPSGGAGAYAAPPQAASTARVAEETERPAPDANGKRARRVMAQRRPAPQAAAPTPYAFRNYYAPPPYRTARPVAPPRGNAAASRRQATASRAWTATFFNRN